jgi:excisionase family DNA binding protein
VKKDEPTPRPESPWMTVAEAAAELRIAKSTIYHLVEIKQLAGIRLGGCVRIPRAAIRDLLKQAEAGVDIKEKLHPRIW